MKLRGAIRSEAETMMYDIGQIRQEGEEIGNMAMASHET
jgi:hypothetical protein